MITPVVDQRRSHAKGDYIFRICFTDSYQGEYQAVFADSWCTRTASRRAWPSSPTSRATTRRAWPRSSRAKFTALGGKIVGTQSYANGDSDFRSQLTAIKATNPSIIFVPGYYTDIGQIAIQARDLGITAPLLGGDGWESPKLIEIGGKALEGCFYTNHYFYGDPVAGRQQLRAEVQGALRTDARRAGRPRLRRDEDAGRRHEARRQAGRSRRCATPSRRPRDFVGVTGTITIDRTATPSARSSSSRRSRTASSR